MYNTGVTGFLTAASNPSRLIDTRVTLRTPQRNILLTPDDIVSYKLLYASVSGKSFTPGSFVATPLELSLNASSTAVSKVDFKSETINSLFVEAGIQASQMVYIPMGVFYLDKDGVSTEDDGHVVITATDLPPVMSETFNSNNLNFPCTIQAALEKVSLDIGIPIHVSASDFPNLSVVLTKTAELSSTYREALRYIAETLGAYVSMGRDGEVYLKKLFGGIANLGFVLDDNYLFSVNQQESTVEPFQYVSIKANEDDIGVSQEVSGVTTGREYSVFDNPFTFGHSEDFLEGLVEPISFRAFHPTKISFQGRPDLDVGDVLEYAYKGNTYILPVCNHIFEYNGGFKTTLESMGSDSLKMSSLDSGMKHKVTAIRQNINTLVRDLTQTQSQITEVNGEVVKMSQILQTVEALQTQISKIEGDVTKMSTLTQTAEQLRLDIQSVAKDLTSTNDKVNGNQQTILTYFDFQADGLTIGLSSSNIKLKLSNNQVQFLREGSSTPVAYFSDGQLYVTDAHFIRSLVLGNFEFVPRTNGNLSLKRRS